MNSVELTPENYQRIKRSCVESLTSRKPLTDIVTIKDIKDLICHYIDYAHFVDAVFTSLLVEKEVKDEFQEEFFKFFHYVKDDVEYIDEFPEELHHSIREVYKILYPEEDDAMANGKRHEEVVRKILSLELSFDKADYCYKNLKFFSE